MSKKTRPSRKATVGTALAKAAEHVRTGHFMNAISALEQAIELDRRDPRPHNQIGLIHAQHSRFDLALPFFERAAKLAPTSPALKNNLGGALLALNRPWEAKEHLRRATALKKSFAPAWINLGRAERLIGNCGRAVKCFEHARATASEIEGLNAELGEAYLDLGMTEDAIGAFFGELKTSPVSAQALHGLAQARRWNDEALLPAISRALEDTGQTFKAVSALHHARGKVLEDLGRYDDAWSAFERANLVPQNIKMGDGLQEADWFMRLPQMFTKDFFERRRAFGHPSSRPIFIIGMPRSGTTLVEQILASHKDVKGGGELIDIRLLASELLGGEKHVKGPVAPPPQIAQSQILSAAERYLSKLELIDPTSHRLTDKMPDNFQFLWLIGLMFPKASIIHCVRDPLDTCVSCYTTHFNEHHAYARDQRSLGNYYRSYGRLMEHWKACLPCRITDIEYEDLVNSPRPSIEYLLQRTGLKWDDACLEFHKSARPVQSPSRVQIRSPIHSQSVGRAARFSKHLQPLRSALGIRE